MSDNFSFNSRIPPSHGFVIPPGGFPNDRVVQNGPYLFGRQNYPLFESELAPATQFSLNTVAPPAAFQNYYSHAEFVSSPVPRESLPTGRTSSQTRETSKPASEQSRNRWTDGEVKLLIAIYGEEFKNREKGRSLEPMWDKIAARLVAESKEFNNFICDKSAKNCRDKINNLNKKYKAVKDKSKMTGEGSDDIKSFPEFDELDQLWGTRDSVNPKYVIEAGTLQSTPSPSTSAAGASSGDSGPSTSGDSGPTASQDDSEGSEINENSPLSSAHTRRRSNTEKGPCQQPQGKRSLPAEADLSDEALERSERLFFKSKKGKQPEANKKNKSKSRRREKKAKEDEEQKEDDFYAELIKAQTEALKKADEEKKQLFDYLRESDNRTQELVLGAIRELGQILKK
ncbi:hypothetical protein ACROYT_G016270 [Oculina patagonica]